MLKPQYFVLLAALLVCGGTVTAQPNPPQLDAGTGGDLASLQDKEGGTVERKPGAMDDTHRPSKPRWLTTLDGRAIAAARAAIQDLMARSVKEDKRNAGNCGSSPKAMDVLIFEAEDMYIVRINWRLDRCGWAHPSFNSALDPEFYAVSPEGKFLVRNPYNHAAPVIRKPLIIDGIRWPEEARLLAMLDGRAAVASYVAMQGFMTRFVREKRSAGDYNPSPKNVDVLIFELEDLYAVRINPRVGTHGWVDPNLQVGLEPEVLVLSPEGKLLGRFPDSLTQLLQPILRMNSGRVGAHHPVGPRTDAGASTAQPASDGGIRWPEEMLPLAILDGPAIAASNAAMQHLQARLKQKHGEACLAPVSAMQVLVGREAELYFVRIELHGGRCGAADAGAGTDEVVLYAVSPEGEVQVIEPKE